MGRDVVETNWGASALLGSSGEPPGHGPGGGHLLTVDVGGTHLRCAIVSPEGDVSDHQRIDTPISSPDTGPVVEFIRRAAADAGAAAVVIGLPGRIDYERGCLDRAPNLPAGWVNALDESDLSEAVGLPVSVANDADLAAVGEAWLGAGRPWSDVVYVTVSTGVGAGVVLGDQLVHGRRSLAEIGHCLVDQAVLGIGADATSIEDVASGAALGRRAARAGLVASGPEIVTAIRAGDARLAGVWEDQVRAVGLAVVNLTWIFTLQAVVVGGGLGLVGAMLLEPISELVSRLGPRLLPEPIAVVPAALGDDAGLIGGAAWSRAFRPEAAGRSISGPA
jgi:glucokinase